MLRMTLETLSLHSAGLTAKRAIEDARQKVTELINAEDETCIIFTSGATESNNMAIKGTALRNIQKGKKVAASAIEHISVLNPAKELQKISVLILCNLVVLYVDTHNTRVSTRNDP